MKFDARALHQKKTIPMKVWHCLMVMSPSTEYSESSPQSFIILSSNKFHLPRLTLQCSNACGAAPVEPFAGLVEVNGN
jgi:hypothetical protein